MSLRIVGIRKGEKSFLQGQTAHFPEQSSSAARASSNAITSCAPNSMTALENARLWPRNTVLPERTRTAVHLTVIENAMFSRNRTFLVWITLESLELRVGK